MEIKLHSNLKIRFFKYKLRVAATPKPRTGSYARHHTNNKFIYRFHINKY